MKQIILLLMLTSCPLAILAQSYTEHVQQRAQGKGTVTVTHSKEIDDLVNAKGTATTQKQTTTKPNTTTGTVAPISQAEQEEADKKAEEARKEEQAQKEKEEQIRREKEELARRIAEQRLQEAEENGETTIDTSKKVMRKSYKVNGYRVQAFLGGNSRADREKAEQIGNAIKKKYPLEPIYVHFYSPRWTCRVGNYRTYEEAAKMLNNLRKMGYKQATILKGKITVQY